MASPVPAAPRDPRSLWQGVVEQAPTRQLRALLGQVELLSLEGAQLHIRAAAAVAPMIEARRSAIEPLLRQVAGRPLTLAVQAEPAPASVEAAAGAPGADEAGEQPAGAPGSSPAPDEEHPLVRRAAELFKAKVVHVEPLRRPQ